ncbi:L,D-transpeptidase [Nonomuraea jiangxiensis]|uniref:L,D-transpeptidase catalytic domain n=1 Tax=Nonomuraea jiangxiensis TaxID=633440 RepID=A0A1G8FYI1_9ACTN|nr:L,D-transpeptidase [Nonomuraea jiangxiensis]SDH87036.1 L,D-transpeptidase catalytic domain [Nonomuraea jiangxiensis]
MNRVPRMLPALVALVAMTACAAETAPVPLSSAAPARAVAAAGVAAPATTPPATPVPSAPAKKVTLKIADITPMGEKTEKVGVGFPIIVTFDRDVKARADVEALLDVQADKPVEGAWRWVSARKVIYRTKTYWKPHQKVLFTARLSQLPGNTGGKDVSRRFAVGTSNISVVDTRKHQMKVYRDGKIAKKIPISAGSGGMVKNGVDVFLTTSGVHLTMGKKAMETMTSGWMGVTDPKDPRYYKEQIPWAVRISDSGEYVHQSAGYYQYLGRSNMSHGCVRATPAGAKWFYGIAQRGDVVKITGTKRKLDWTNGWSYWQLNWTEWKKGSALKS